MRIMSFLLYFVFHIINSIDETSLLCNIPIDAAAQFL